MTINLSIFTPTTLAAMAAEYSQYLAEEFDGDGVSAQQWDAMAEDLAAIVNQLQANTDDFMALLMDAGADPGVIFDGSPQ